MSEPLLQNVALAWSPPLTGWLLAAAALVLVAALVASAVGYRRVAPGPRLALLSLRALALATLALVLAGPVWVHSEGQHRRDPLAVLIDASRSMRVQDVEAGSRSAAVDRWLAARSAEFEGLAEDYRLRFFLVGDEPVPWTPGEPIAATATASDLGRALFGLRDALGGERPAGVLLVSDGADRAALGRAMRSQGAAGVERLVRELGFPVSTWALGSGDGPPDLRATLRVPPFGFVRRPLVIEAEIGLHSLASQGVEVLLREDGEIIASRDVALQQGETRSLSFEVKPDRLGFHTYRLELPDLEGDAIAQNNAAEATVKVLRDRTRVLQVTSRPSWDVKFLRRLLKTDPNIDLVSFFILRNSERRGRLARSGQLSLIAFPYEELFSEDLQGFDLVIFQNFWFGSFTHHPPDRFLRNVADYVRAGGAFLMVGGDSSFGEGDYGGSALAEVMPTTIPASSLRGERFQAVLTSTGRRHPITRLDRDPERNDRRWKDLPLLGGLNPLGALRQGAVRLLDAGVGGAPLAAARTVGRGRTMAFASGETWRWSMAGVGGRGAGREHAKFWRNAVRWLVKDLEQEQVQVLLDADNYELGDAVQLQVRVLGEDYAPRPGVEVIGSIGGLDGEPWQQISAQTDAAGQIMVTTSARDEGVMVAAVDVVGIPAPFGHAEARASVSERRGELADPRSVPELLAALARGTGGTTLRGEQPDPGAMVRREGNAMLTTHRSVEPLWSRWWWLLLAILPLALEWTLRRRIGLR